MFVFFATGTSDPNLTKIPLYILLINFSVTRKVYWPLLQKKSKVDNHNLVVNSQALEPGSHTRHSLVKF